MANASNPRAANPRGSNPRESVHCSRCEATCCRLTVVVFPDDAIPAHMTLRDTHGFTTMARGEDGWCVALDRARMNCGIYPSRPAICRKFKMGGPYCREVRSDAAREARAIPLTLIR